MSTQIMMGIVIAIGFGAAVFLVSNGFEDPNKTETSAAADGTENGGDASIESNSGNSELTNEQMFVNIEASIDANPGERVRAYKYGMALVGLKEFTRAERFFQKQLELFPRDIRIAYGLGWCFEQNKKWPEAVDAYTKALEIDGTHRESKNNLAWILATSPVEEIRDGERAVVLARQALGNEQPQNSKYMDTLAAAYAEAGSFENAVKVQEYVSRKTEGIHAGVEKRLRLYQMDKPYRMPE